MTLHTPSLFEQLNAFVADHVECSDVGEGLAYAAACRQRAEQCEVAVNCRCGATATFSSTREDAEEFTAIARRSGIPAYISHEEVATRP